MSEVCPFLKEMKRKDRDPLRSLVQSKWYLRARTGHLSSLNCVSTIVVKAGIVTGDTLWESSLASWFLLIKSKKGNNATFSLWPRLDTLFATQAWISLWSLLEAKASKKAVFRVRCLMSVSFIGSKSAFVNSLRTAERFHLGRFLELLGRSLWKLVSNLWRSELCEIWWPVGPKVSTMAVL